MKSACALLCVLAAACAAGTRTGSAAANGTVDSVAWLAGCWSYTSPRGTVIEERWRRAARDTMAGAGVTRRDGAVVESEIMQVVARGDTLFFIAEPSGQTRTEFRAATVSATGAVFENRQHDFPQRVAYRAVRDSLHARIDGIVDGSERAIDFPMARAQCAD